MREYFEKGEERVAIKEIKMGEKKYHCFCINENSEMNQKISLFVTQLREVNLFKHPNIITFYGIINTPQLRIVNQFCPFGNLRSK